ncbi:DUF58 domain-containing protein [Aeromicrobium sp. CF4.19]|uniref:DUF58 domain-containing protein n=1 Tax=Aeromicrobium sp. CF4.19 TaxID=3373082 RepID=UPI003EE6380D
MTVAGAGPTRLGRWRRRLREAGTSVRPTSRGVGFLVVAAGTFVAAPLLSLPALQQVTGLLLGLVVLAALFVVAGHSRVRIERTFDPEVVTPGRASRATVRITNVRSLPCLSSRWRDTLSAGLTGEAGGWVPGLSGSGGPEPSAVVSYDLHGLRRGRHGVGPLAMDVEDPFGLVTRRLAVGEREEVIVLPRRSDVVSGGSLVSDRDGASRPAPQHAGLGSDDVVARSYLPGDALKRMHWKATAHRGELMVRQEEQHDDPRAAVVLDTDDISFGTVQDHRGVWDFAPDLEWVVSAAASLVTHLAGQGCAVTVRALGAFERRVAEQGDALEDVLLDLAVLEPTTGAEVDRGSARVAERGVIVLLGRPESGRALAWTRALAGSTVTAFASRSTRSEVLDSLETAGWNVATYAPGDDVGSLWAETRGGAGRAAS